MVILGSKRLFVPAFSLCVLAKLKVGFTHHIVQGLGLIVVRHLGDRFLVNSNGLLVLSLVGVEPTKVEESRDLGALVSLGILETRAVQLGAVPVHINSFVFPSHDAKDKAHV
uniref:Uncharacterized protein n=1 Tax=Ixodes ricinus TaxID=34613 RepID=A0A6B0UK15_IXORI